MDISAASSNNQHRDFSTDTFTYRTHNIRSGDIKQLSEHTAAACSVKEGRGKAMSTQRTGSEEADRKNANLRLLNNGETICHGLNIVKNVGEWGTGGPVNMSLSLCFKSFSEWS